MNEHTFDALTRQAARGISRRASLFTLGTTGLAALAATSTAKAGKKSKKRKKDKKCKRQVDQCNAVFAPLCADPEAPEDCAEQTSVCCEFLAECQADAFLSCFLELLGIPEDPTPV